MPEAPLATEENLEDSEPLPYWYTVEADTVACLMIRNRSNGSHLIYRKRLQDYIVIPEQSFAHIKVDMQTSARDFGNKSCRLKDLHLLEE